ncbi:ATP-dependent Clp protease ATP-binding subunit ClpB [Nematocida minor]|uniref:ATP-dependent Clp protease ATP-binding subunit ClpB n=1 Tax=Nematocida minor TaxID=1912983 RepID=UPI00221ED282|nr:ATP-dependent Clp protease ATP-binding subunit ClpB [Nematocida minor]KAI5189683.1 ATP-dependent Clp protease ATP-binding subunit ClpB [Nematocida minor]
MSYGQGLNSKELTEVIKKAEALAKTSRSYTVDPVHVLLVLLSSGSLAIKKAIKDNEEIKKRAQEYIDNDQKAPDHVTPKINEQELGSLLITSRTIAQKEGSEIKEIHILYGTLKSPSILKILRDINVQEILDRIENVKEREESSIEEFAVDMVQQAKDGLFDPVIGRDKEIRSILEILTKKIKSNAMLLGEPGVGKTAIVNGLAQLIANDQAPSLAGCRIYSVDLGALVAGAMYHGQFEERLKSLIKAAEESKRKTILFIDEIHMVLGAGKTQGAMNAANLLKPGLASGAIRCIGATTFAEYKQYVEKDPAFERRFITVSVPEPSVEDTVTILRGLRERFESYHGLSILNETLECAAEMGERYLTGGHMPDTAITLLDAACSSVKVALETEPAEVMTLKSKIWAAEIEKQAILIDTTRDENINNDVRLSRVDEKISSLYNKLIPLEKEHGERMEHIVKRKRFRTKLESLKTKLAEAERTRNTSLAYDIKSFAIPEIEEELSKLGEKDSQICIRPEHIAEMVSSITGIPAKRLTKSENKRLLELEARLAARVVGQKEPISAVTNAIIRSKAGFGRARRPIGSFLFLGPTGVGKTQLAKTLAYELFDDENAMVRIDMSEYMEPHSVSRLIGAPPGYVGYETGGYLTEKIRNKPYSIILIDEIEKAHKRVSNVFLQVLDDGHLTDGQGRTVDFSNTVILMTSNLGSEEIMNSNGAMDREHMLHAAKRFFPPEFINRLDGVQIFKPLEMDNLIDIVGIYMKEINARLGKHKIDMVVTEDAMRKIIEESYTPEYGARPMQRFIEQSIVTDISKIYLGFTDNKPCEITVTSVNREVPADIEAIEESEYFRYYLTHKE